MKNLRQARYQQKLSISELSQAARVERSVIMAYEYGTGDLILTHKERIETVLFVDRNAYFGKDFTFADSLRDRFGLELKGV